MWKEEVLRRRNGREVNEEIVICVLEVLAYHVSLKKITTEEYLIKKKIKTYGGTVEEKILS